MLDLETMIKMTIEDVVVTTKGRIVYGNNRSHTFTGVSTDSRTINAGDIFIALKGDRFDGHDFVYKALEKCNCALVSFPPSMPVRGKTIIHVENTLKALHDIARSLRLRSSASVIGITGTNGKTTTKELVSSVFVQRHKILKTPGNLNNHVGLPLSICRLEGDEEIMVLEMGSNAKGDIKLLCDIALPHLAVVTNVGPAHLEGFGNLETVRQTDLEILDYVKTAVVNADDVFLMEGLADYSERIVTYGIKNKAKVHAKNINVKERGSSFNLCIDEDSNIEINLNLHGDFNIYNALAAAAAGHVMNIELQDIKKGIESFRGVPMRLEIKNFSGATVINDVYNANPASMEAALKELVRLKKNRAIAVCGDMLELGSYAEEAHKMLGEQLSRLPVDIFIAVGPLMALAESVFAQSGRESYQVANSSDAGNILRSICRADDTVLIKGSRGMQMEKVLDLNMENKDAV